MVGRQTAPANQRHRMHKTLTLRQLALAGTAMIMLCVQSDGAKAGCNSGSGAPGDLLTSDECQASAAGGSALAVGAGASAVDQFRPLSVPTRGARG